MRIIASIFIVYVGGLQMFDPNDTEDGPDGSWVDWCDEVTGYDDPFEYLESLE